MKKSLIALAVLAAAGTASAQSSVTLFGIVDATLQHVSNGSGGASVTRLTSSGYNSSRLGFRGTEDLGGGMSASFWLEAGLNNDDGRGAATNTNNQTTGAALAGLAGGQGLTFNRRSTVSLAGGWGELRLGRDYTPQFWNLTVFDPFGTNGAGTTAQLDAIITGVTSVRASNTIGYFLPGNLGGFYGQVQHYRGENASGAATSSDGNGTGFRVGYAAGPLNVALAVSRTKYAAGDVQQNNIGGAWDFGVAKLLASYSRDKNEALAGDGKGVGYLIGTSVPVGAGEIRASWSQYKVDLGALEPKDRKIAIGYVHNLSKRTAVYATYARAKNSGGTAATAISVVPGAAGVPGANGSSSAFDLGVRHSF